MTTNSRAAGQGKIWVDSIEIEMAFVVWYCVEVLLKLIVHRCYFFLNQEAMWNIFDFLVALWSVAEIVVKELVGAGQLLDIRFIRAIKILKVSKILRIFRAFRFLYELRLMLKCMIGSIVPLLWAGVLLLLLLMIFALIFVEAMIQFQNDHPNLDT